MKMEQLVIFDFVGKQEFQNYVEKQLATDFAFHLSNRIIKKEKELLDKERKIDALVEALEFCLKEMESYDFAIDEAALETANHLDSLKLVLERAKS